MTSANGRLPSYPILSGGILTGMATSAELLAPPKGYQRVFARRLVPTWQSVAANSAEVQSFTFRSASTFGVVLGRVASQVTKLDQQVRARGSRVYAVALYRQKTPAFRITIPRTLLGIPVPGGGSTAISVEQYRLVIVHSQIPVTWPLVVLVLGIAVLLISQTASGRTAIRSFASNLSEVFGGGQVAAASKAANSFVLIWVAGGALITAGTGALYLAYLNKAGDRALPPPSAGLAGLPPLPPVSGGVTGPRGIGISGGILPPAARSTRAPTRSRAA